MLDALSDRPLPTIILVIFLVWIGIRAVRPRTIRYRQLYILPSVFLFISANQLFNSYALSAVGLLAWTAATLIAGGVSWRMAERTAITIKPEEERVGLPGTRVTISLILVFIAIRFYFGRQLTVSPHLRADPAFTAQILAMTGLVTGYYLGRSSSFLVRYFRFRAARAFPD